MHREERYLETLDDLVPQRPGGHADLGGGGARRDARVQRLQPRHEIFARRPRVVAHFPRCLEDELLLLFELVRREDLSARTDGAPVVARHVIEERDGAAQALGGLDGRGLFGERRGRQGPTDAESENRFQHVLAEYWPGGRLSPRRGRGNSSPEAGGAGFARGRAKGRRP